MMEDAVSKSDNVVPALDRYLLALTSFAQTPAASMVYVGPATMAAGYLTEFLRAHPTEKKKVATTEFVLVGLMRLLKTQRQEALKAAFPLLTLLAEHNPLVQDQLGSAAIIDDLCQLLRVATEEVRSIHPGFYALVAQWTVQLLVVLAENHPHNQQLMIAQELLDPLNTLLQARSAKTKEKAAQLLRLLVTDRPDIQSKIRSRTLVKLLTALLNEPNEGVRREAMGALGAIARGHARNQLEMRTLPSVLLSLLRAAQPAEQVCALRALLDLVYNNSVRKQQLRASTEFTRLQRLQSSTNQEVRLAANDLVSHLMFPDPEKSRDGLTFQVGRLDESKDAVDELHLPVVGKSWASARNLLQATAALSTVSTEVCSLPQIVPNTRDTITIHAVAAPPSTMSCASALMAFGVTLEGAEMLTNAYPPEHQAPVSKTPTTFLFFRGNSQALGQTGHAALRSRPI